MKHEMPGLVRGDNGVFFVPWKDCTAWTVPYHHKYDSSSSLRLNTALLHGSPISGRYSGAVFDYDGSQWSLRTVYDETCADHTSVLHSHIHEAAPVDTSVPELDHSFKMPGPLRMR